MKSSLNSEKKSKNQVNKKVAAFLILFVMLFAFVATPTHTAKAIPVEDIPALVWNKIQDIFKKLLLKGGAMAFQQVLRTALNKIAYDTANYLGGGNKGQKPLFITQNWGDYLTQVGDEAAGQFIESFATNLSKPMNAACQTDFQACSKTCLSKVLGVCGGDKQCEELNNSLLSDNASYTSCTSDCKKAASNCDNVSGLSVSGAGSGSAASGGASVSTINVCQPSANAKVKISLGLVEQQRPGAPNCTASTMIQNWGNDINQQLADFKDPYFIQKTTVDLFNPGANDLGIYLSARSDMIKQQATVDKNTSLNLAANKGWQDKTNAAKKLIGIPGDAQLKADASTKEQLAQIGKTTGDILVDAASVFLNQYAVSKFNDLMSQLSKKTSEDGSNSSQAITKSETDANVVYGDGTLNEVTASIIEPDFSVNADYDILSQLVICPDAQNPGPTNCVIDDKFLQGIAGKRTVAEAIKEGYIHSDWQLTNDTAENTYSLRNISILRKYRILPIGWEEAINRATASSTKVTVMDLVSCFDPLDSYYDFSADFNTRNQAWCRGLVDPNWVLKAPLNYCKKQGSSAQIIYQTVIPSIPAIMSNPYTPSSLTVTRAEDYCADEQTCIKEKDDGSCEVFGYCNEEKRTWKFTGDSCEPIFNTCKNFTNSLTGKSFSYLENTLNYDNCNAESAGCRQYSTLGTYATSTGTVGWQANSSLYFNKNISACSNKDEGCTELLRVKPTWGANLVMDADYNNEAVGASSTGATLFNDWHYWSSANTNNGSRKATIVDASYEPGGENGKALKLEVSRSSSGRIVVGVDSDSTNSLLPENFQLISGQSYTLSAYVYLTQGTNVNLYLGTITDGFVASTSQVGSWQYLSITRSAIGTFSQPEFSINADNNTGLPNDKIEVYIKNIKLEASDFATSFSIYGAYRVYEKIIPPYLEKACYVDISSATKDYQLRTDAPAECAKFARKCNREEVGCELFTSVKNNIAVAAQVTSADYCPRECLGYDVYISKEDNFNSPQAENMIPATAKTCTVEAAGCNEFTNLDDLAQGGENKEYYSFLKQCIRPSSSCGSFYSWEGTDSGYQLKAYSLKKDINNNPATTTVSVLPCDANIYNKPLGDPLYNPDCREFYNSSGNVSYRLISQTITCSDNCHAFRMSDKNIDNTLTQAQCNASPVNSYWEASINSCYVCINGGAWDNGLKACVYQAIPDEGKVCQATENGCREYNGNDGNNVRVLSYYDFETGAQGWFSNCPGGLGWTTISNNKNGHSLVYNDSNGACLGIGLEATNSVVRTPIIKQVFANASEAAQLKVGTQVTQGKSYSLRFIARATADTNPQIYFFNNNAADPQKAYFATSTLVIKGGGEWNIYQTNLENLDHKVTDNELLIITANNDFYFDEVILTEITDRYYLIKNSSEIPDICYYDIFDNYQGADYNLGCAQYLDRSNLVHNLHKFSKLCSDSAVGCEQMILTQNYSPYGIGIWNDTNENRVCDIDEPDCVKVNGDQAIYAVYNESKLCNVADMGCSRLGQGVTGTTAWTDVYKKNNPNDYNKILCSAGEVGCEEWRGSDNTLNYFRDPGNEACQYRPSKDQTIIGKAWYKIPVKRCDANSDGSISGSEMTGKVCNSVNDCSSKPCIIDTNDYLCSNSNLKTFGLGGAGNQIPVPDQQAGLCESNSSGCTEYIDPVSRFSPNLVYNASFESSPSGSVDGWGPTSNEKWEGRSLVGDEQIVKIEPNKLYVFSNKDNISGAFTGFTFLSEVRELLSDNNLASTSQTSFAINIPANQNRIFASLNNNRVLVKGGNSGKTIEIKALIIGYQLQENIDKTSCNGIVNFDNGCVLFNERTINGSNGLVDLSAKWDAASSTDKAAPVNCDETIKGSCTANKLIKVRPDRTCNKWLDCLTYVKDPLTQARTCYAVGVCTRLDDKNECINFEDSVSTTVKFSNTGQNQNAVGYYLLDKYHLSNMEEKGLNTDAHYDFEDNVPSLSCVRASGGACAFNKNIVTDLLIREPEKSKTETDYPAHGATYLKVPSAYWVSPQSNSNWISVKRGETYYINFLLNTKNSGVGARVKIETKSGGNLTFNKFYTANNGWERKIDSFTIGSSSPVKIDDLLIRISLGASDPAKEGSIYFDDINIEPVLEISQVNGTKEYASRECRLYPTNDSLTCVNKNNNTLKDGWEGYCLEHDANNKNVCTMWYPVDQISSAVTARNTLGYQGKFPLSYCTEVNGNFGLVEKRIAKASYYDNNNGDHGFQCWYETGHLGNYCVTNVPYDWRGTATDRIGDANVMAYCTKGYFAIDVWGWGGRYVLCLPSTYGGYQNLVPDAQSTISFTMPNLPNSDNPVPIKIPVSNGWFLYDGLFFRDGVDSCQNVPCTYYINEAKNATPPIRVYNYDSPPADEDGLKLLSGNEPDKIFNLTCSRFSQVVDNNGDNKAWASRVGLNSIWSTSTPAFFIDTNYTWTVLYGKSYYSDHKIDAYGRNREDTPFGSAVWPDSFSILNSEPIKLRNQYSKKNNEEVFAGRPYGCNNGPGCNSIGYCSLDPSVYCLLVGTPEFNKQTCASGSYGTCVPLWSKNLETVFSNKFDFKDILKTIFLKTYNSYYYDGTSYTSDSFGEYDNVGTILSKSQCKPRPINSDAVPPAQPNLDDSFCPIYPTLGSVAMKFGKTAVATTTPTVFNIAKKGIYSLEFTTTIDPEQQPLKEIYIDWGDGNKQVITGQDSRPDSLNPHIFYHYYKGASLMHVQIVIADNWGATGQY